MTDTNKASKGSRFGSDELAAMRSALTASGGNVAAAARLLGLPRITLAQRIRRGVLGPYAPAAPIDRGGLTSLTARAPIVRLTPLELGLVQAAAQRRGLTVEATLAVAVRDWLERVY